LQRLFTTFAGGWPGFGLLIQRLVTGAALIQHGVVVFRQSPPAVTMPPQAAASGLAILVIFGLWTPVVGAMIAMLETWIALADPASPGSPILLAALGATLAMIGPGAFSVDARLFGRRHFGG
jgi:putative oxidoreductase